MNRREFMLGTLATGLAGCRLGDFGAGGGRLLFGACRGLDDVPAMARLGYDYWEWGVDEAVAPDRDETWWRTRRDELRAAPIPMISCNGFLPGRFRLTGPKADHAPILDYAERGLRRANEVGVKTVVFGSGTARNVPGDYTDKDYRKKPDIERGLEQFTDFCRVLCERVKDIDTVIVIEPLMPNESNIIHYVWQGLQICKAVDSPRLAQLADFFHMMRGGESAESVVRAGKLLRHCHVSDVKRRPPTAASIPELTPYFAALKEIGYAGGVSCECIWPKPAAERERALAVALETLKRLGREA